MSGVEGQESDIKVPGSGGRLRFWSGIYGVGLRVLFFGLCLGLMGAIFTPVVIAQNNTPRLTVMVEALNVRSGPGLSYPVTGLLKQDDAVDVIGQHPASGWWQIQLPDGGEGWVTGVSTYARVSGDTANVPEVAAPLAAAVMETTPAAPLPPGPGDGTIVFQASSGGPIYAIDAAGSNLRYLTTGLDPALSPDGRWVAFTRWDSPGFGALGSVWVIKVDGSGERPILSGIAGNPKSPTWSPDGRQLAFNMQLAGGHGEELRLCGKSSVPAGAYDIKWIVSDDGRGSFCYTLPPESFWGLRVVDVTTGAFRDLPHDAHAFSPAWDPANDWRLVFDSERGLTSLDINQGTAWPLTADALDHSPVFSPDGQRLAVTYLQHNHWDIHVLNTDGSGRIRLTETPLISIVEQRLRGEEPRIWNNVSATWSPDGSQIAFLSDRSGQWDIWVMNADGSNQRPLFPAGTLAGIDFQYNDVDERMISWER